MKILPSEITPYQTYCNRRKFIKEAIAISLSGFVSGPSLGFHQSNAVDFSNSLGPNDKLNEYEKN